MDRVLSVFSCFEWLHLLVIVAATWRLTNLLNREDGPWAVFVRLRHCLGAEEGVGGVMAEPGTLAELIVCHYCLSMWVPLVIFALWIWAPPVVWVLAVSAGSIWIHEGREALSAVASLAHRQNGRLDE